ncbi:hypothetical protein C0995_016489 [Termitomyces sp. Mi166|nr:hypothetical protein C0995_016489 [Termitomyces sp. Mi166\
MEFLSQFDCRIVYVKEEDNTVVNALSRLPVTEPENSKVAVIAALHLYVFPDDSSPAMVLILPADGILPWAAAYSLVKAEEVEAALLAATLSVSNDPDLLKTIVTGYDSDPWIQSLARTALGMSNVSNIDGLWFIGDRFHIPHVGTV